MPYKTDKISINDSFLKRSVKLLPCQKERIVYYSGLGMSQRKLASMFNVSRRLIQFILDPKKVEDNLERRRQRGGTKIYYNKEKNTITVREHRKYKYQLLKSTI
jgi:transposase